MPPRSLFLGAASHLLALAAGWAAVRAFHPSAPPAPAEAGKVETATTATAGRRPGSITTSDALLKAYEDPKTMQEMMARRNKPASPNPPPHPDGTPAERAAAAKDIPGDLNKELAKVQAGTGYDYLYTKALISRWMKEDTAACVQWLANMDLKTNWGDPFDAFARSVPPLQALDLMENGWPGINRSRALYQIAQVTGSLLPADLPAVLARLREEEKPSFLQSALGHAESADAAVWIRIAGSDEKLLSSLASKWLQAGLNTDWQQNAERVLAAAAGTPAEDIFRRRYDATVLYVRVDEALARIPKEPAAAAAALEAIYREQGLSADEARAKMVESVSSGSHAGGLSEWGRDEWQSSLQLALLGKLPMRDAVENRLAAIDRELPAAFQAGSRAATLKEAIRIDPTTVIDLAFDRDMKSEAIAAAGEVVRDYQGPFAIRAEALLSLASHGVWSELQDERSAKDFAARYYRYDPEGARQWQQSLPPAIGTSLEEVMR